LLGSSRSLDDRCRLRDCSHVPAASVALASVILIDEILYLVGEELRDHLVVGGAAVPDTQAQSLGLCFAVIEFSLELGDSLRVSLRSGLVLEVELLKPLDALVLLRDLAFKLLPGSRQLSHLLDMSLSAAHLTLRTLTLNVIDLVKLTCLDESYEFEHDRLEGALEVLGGRLKCGLAAFFLLGLRWPRKEDQVMQAAEETQASVLALAAKELLQLERVLVRHLHVSRAQ
jgi:hypothetical protein